MNFHDIIYIFRHYWSAGAGLGHHMCGEEVLSNLRWDGPPLDIISGRVNVNTLQVDIELFFFKVPHYFIIIIYQIYIRWMLLEGWKIRLSPGEHPLLLARIPEMTDAMCTSLASTMQKKKKKNNCQEAHFLFSSSFFAIPFGHSLHRVHRPSGLFVGFT